MIRNGEVCLFHADYLSRDVTGEAKPDLLVTIKRIREENPRIGANGAMERAVEIVRHWAIAHGYCA
jgi:hypothetical protein